MVLYTTGECSLIRTALRCRPVRDWVPTQIPENWKDYGHQTRVILLHNMVRSTLHTTELSHSALYVQLVLVHGPDHYVVTCIYGWLQLTEDVVFRRLPWWRASAKGAKLAGIDISLEFESRHLGQDVAVLYTSVWSFHTTRCNEVFPSLSQAPIEAPLVRSSSAVLIRPFSAAWCK